MLTAMAVTTVKHFSGRQAGSFSAALKWRGMIFALAAGLCTSSCALLNFPSAPELTLVNVGAVLPPFSKYHSPLLDWYSGLREPLLVVSVAASRNLLRLSAAHELNLGTEVSTCPFEARPGLRYDPYLYVQDIEANKLTWDKGNSKSVGVEIDAYDSLSVDRTYSILILQKFDSSRYAQKVDVKGPLVRIYDLTANPQDICIKIRGFSMLGYGFESTILTVPKEQIIRALQQPISE